MWFGTCGQDLWDIVAGRNVRRQSERHLPLWALSGRVPVSQGVAGGDDKASGVQPNSMLSGMFVVQDKDSLSPYGEEVSHLSGLQAIVHDC